MPKQFKKIFILNGCAVSCRKRTDKSSCSYELRYRKDGYNISASGRTLELAKLNFIKKVNLSHNKKELYPTVFKDFALFFLENYKKRTICEKEYKKYNTYLNNTIFPFFKRFKLQDISPLHCQKLIDNTIEKGQPRKAEDIKSILNQVFNYAINLNLIATNPVALVVYQKHQRKHGKALTKEEEKHLLEITKGTPYRVQFAFLLYSGLRPNEGLSVQISNGFILAINSKRKGGKEQYKRIPINPMLEPFIDDFTGFFRPKRLYRHFVEYMPNHKLYDLRTTFFNRCVECGINESVRDSWLGHNSTAIKQAYTDISDELNKKESQKLSYSLL